MPGFSLPKDASAERIALDFLVYLLAPGGSMVLVFFVISGFVLSTSFADAGSRFAELIAFWVKRLFRIMPALWVAIAFAVLVMIMKRHPIPWEAVKQSALLDPRGFTAVNHPLWSLHVEMVAYLYFPAQLLLARWLGVWAHVSLIAGCATLLLLERHGLNSLGWYFRNPYALLCFQLGIAAASYGRQIVERVNRPAMLTASLCALLLPIPLYLILGVGAKYFDTIISFGAFGIVSLTAYGSRGAIQRLLLSKPLRFLGLVSYSFYLLHVPVLELVSRLVDRFAPSVRLFTFPFGSPHFFPGLFRLPLVLAVLLPLSWASYRLIEAPFNRIGHRLARRL